MVPPPLLPPLTPPPAWIDIGTADDLFVDVAVFASASIWGGGDEDTAAMPVWVNAEVSATATTDAGVVADGGASSGTDRAAAAGAGMAAGGVPGRGLGVGTSADAHSLATKKRRRKFSQATTRDVQRHCQRMTELGTARGNSHLPSGESTFTVL